jgi:SAM-dependent methyltransferase
MNSEKKTEKDFWSDFWQNHKLPQIVNLKLKNDRVIAESIKKYVVRKENAKALEIGTSFGKWLVFLHKEFGFKVTGYEYLEELILPARKNLEICGVAKENFNIVQRDFLNSPLDEKFDLTLSLGFVEHFENVLEVIKKHAEVTKPGGQIIIGIPRFKGIGYFIQKTIDKDSDNPLLPAHNLSIMEPEILADLGQQAGLKVVDSFYVGGFEQGLFDWRKIKNPFVRLFIRCLSKASVVFFGRINAKPFASYIMAIFEKVKEK